MRSVRNYLSGRLSMVDGHACFGLFKFFDHFFFLTQSHSYLRVEIGLKWSFPGFFQLTLHSDLYKVFSTLRMAVHLRENQKFPEVPWKNP